MENEIMDTAEVVEGIVDSGKNGWTIAAIAGGSALLGAFVWDRAVKPAIRWAKSKVSARKEIATQSADVLVEEKKTPAK